jgi:hypothetical protein
MGSCCVTATLTMSDMVDASIGVMQVRYLGNEAIANTAGYLRR